MTRNIFREMEKHRNLSAFAEGVEELKRQEFEDIRSIKSSKEQTFDKKVVK